MKILPKISVLCITYNQEKYVKQMLDSIVNQVTNFPIEIIIGDDCSNDKTVSIIKEYEKKYSKLIKPIYRSKNIGAMENLKDIFIRAKGKYISLCEGDDYFIANNKLQIQYDFLNRHPKYSLCFHPVNVIFENKEEKNFIYPDPNRLYKFSLTELLKWNYIQTNSVLYRNLYNYTDIPTNILPGDWYLHLYHAKYGKIGYIKKIMSVYRKHSGGLWWNSKYDINNLLIKNGIKQIGLYFEIIKLFNKTDTNYVDDNVDYILKKFLEIDNNLKTNLFNNSALKYPTEMMQFFIRRYKNLNLNNNNIISTRSDDSEKLREITESKLYVLWPIYSKIKKILFAIIHKF